MIENKPTVVFVLRGEMEDNSASPEISIGENIVVAALLSNNLLPDFQSIIISSPR